MNSKQISVIVLTISIGLLSELIGLIHFNTSETMMIIVDVLNLISPNLDLDILRVWSLEYQNPKTGLEVNFIDIGVYAIILLGVMIYTFSIDKYKNVIRFAFSIILISNCIAVLYFANLILLNQNPFQIEPVYITGFFWFLSKLLWIIISYKMIRSFQTKRVLVLDNNDLQYTSKPQRFIHLLLDLCISILVCSKIVVFIISHISLGEKMNIHLKEFFVISLILFLSRTFYYIFFEYLFSSSPAKFITGSRVITKQGGNISIQRSFMRSIVRHIPLEGLTYLLFKNGWHDEWFNTRVVKESSLKEHD